MLQRLIRDAHLIVASLAVAILAWLYVQSDAVYTDQVRARIDWHVAADLVAVDGLPGQLSLRVRGSRAQIRRAHRAQLSVDVDITDIGAGQHTLEFAPFRVDELPSGLEVLTRSPSGVRFVLDKLGERSVELRPRVVGRPSGGYQVESVTIQPAVLTIRGPLSRLADLAVVDTQPIDVSDLASDATVPTDVELPRGMERAEATALSAEVRVLAMTEQRTFSDVPIHTWSSTSYRPLVDNTVVILEGPPTLLRQIPPEDVTAFVHPPEGPQRSRFMATWGNGAAPRLRVLHSGGPEVRVVSVAPATVEVVGR